MSLPQPQDAFITTESLDNLIAPLDKPLKYKLDLELQIAEGVKSSYPFKGGERPWMERLNHIVVSGTMNGY